MELTFSIVLENWNWNIVGIECGRSLYRLKKWSIWEGELSQVTKW